MTPLDEASGRDLWAAYVAEHPEFGGELPPLERFGDSEQMADELFDLVRAGPKRATAGLVADYVAASEPLPRVGDHWIAARADGIAKLVLRSLELRIGRLDSVDERFAWDEGEGDRSVDWWLDAHRAYFARRCTTLGLELPGPDGVDAVEVVFERFTPVWPPTPNRPSGPSITS